MNTIYNLDMVVEPCTNMPQELYDRSVEQLEQAGILGKKHTNEFGRLYNDFDPDCETCYEGKMNLFYRQGFGDLTMPEMLHQAQITTSGDDKQRMKALSLWEGVIEILGKYDPLSAILPFKDYTQTPLISCMELNLACGKQSPHVHIKGRDHIRFIRPRKDAYWYDYDQLKNFTWGAVFEDFDLTFERMETRNPWKRRKINQEKKKLKYLIELHKDLIMNPDSIDRIEF